MRLRSLVLPAAVALAAVAVSGCDCSTGCDVSAARLWDDAPTLAMPTTVARGAPVTATVRARTRVAGVGRVQLLSGVERLRVLSPVIDTVDFAANVSIATAPVRVVFGAGETVEVAWRIAVDDLPDLNLLSAELRARVEVDSVRVADGRLLPATPEALCSVLPEACGDVLPAEASAPLRLTLTP